MSKHRPPKATFQPALQTGAVTADSPVDAIRAERMRVAEELQRRKEYEYLQMLRAELDETPPVPEPHPPPANDG
ncbi:hypothetical protein [Caulobacter sp. X]|uniref:hypothetical protein n=1 Tax=Caulobacter sp. X TaxID=2048901 RepID=UPI000C14DD1F|nr:hypothetical protein [Caulobacter sp. X]PIC01738.1 hypothetical protein CSW60_09715 [Caulobacter sp. X]